MPTKPGELSLTYTHRDKLITSSSSTITLSCLASTTSYLSCTELSHHVDDHYSINENYVPSDFLNLVSDALSEAYPRTQTLEDMRKEDAVSPAVYTLLDTLKAKIDTLPTDFALQAFEAVRPGLLVWLTDENKVVMPQHAARVSQAFLVVRFGKLTKQVDHLYVSVLRLLGNGIDQGHLARQAEIFDSLVEVVAPRLSRAASRIVPEAFQSLWAHFADIETNKFSVETIAFLQSVIAAVPDLITVKGLSGSSEMSEVSL